MFFQQDLESAPAFVKTIRRTNQEGRELDYAVFTTIGSMLHFVNQGNIEQHPWHSTVKHPDKPDYVMLDLDPKQAPWENVLQVALVCKEVLDELRSAGVSKNIRVVRHSHLSAFETEIRIPKSRGPGGSLGRRSRPARTEDRDSSTIAGEAPETAGLR